mgnify:CR=1 FL=1
MAEEMDEMSAVEKYRRTLEGLTDAKLKGALGTLRAQLEKAVAVEQEKLQAYEEAKRARRIIELKISALREEWGKRLEK